ncbi:putative cobalt-precorrin-6B C(15)-methyltransferase (decarboxylating) [uncultured archaeon]|nr:putative cobalt-precorrin-6B C(15)-methyltransferase (decarboxylating) [uncultured archaeon]
MITTIPNWQYDEPDHPGADFGALAEIYDRNMQKYRDIQAEIREILSFLDLRPDHTVIEIGTGTGEFALAVACHCSKVYAVDLSDGMLRYAEKKARSRGVKNVEFISGGFLTYQHPTPVDAVVSQLALHHLPDFWKQVALMRISDMLSDGGKLCLRDVVFNFDIKDHENLIENYISRASEMMGDEFAGRIAAHVKKEYSTMGWIIEGMIEQAGFKVIRKAYTDWFIGTYFCIKQPAAALFEVGPSKASDERR